MYTPSHYNNNNVTDAIEFMETFNFASVITSVNEKPIASHLPFTISKRKDKIVLNSHFSAANEQSINFEDKNILTIFTEPHAYISPKFYEKKQNVPTWNYLSVHAYGNAKIIQKEAKKIIAMEQMILKFEKEYLVQWNQLDSTYKSNMLKGIVVFEIIVNELQFKEKLSQNKKEKEQESIITEFSRSKKQNENLIAKYMSKKSN